MSSMWDWRSRMSDQKPISRRVSPIFSLSSSRPCVDHFAAVPQPDDGEAVFGANPGLEHGLADQLDSAGRMTSAVPISCERSTK